jgi:hypothetical protein
MKRLKEEARVKRTYRGEGGIVVCEVAEDDLSGLLGLLKYLVLLDDS